MIDRPFETDHISQIHEDLLLHDDLFSSQFTDATHELQQDSYQDQRAYAKQQLSNWGLQMGELPYSQDNLNTLRCLLQMIGSRQRDMQYRSMVKDDMAILQFEKEKYRSFMEQKQCALEECSKRLGRLQNENSEIRAQSKRVQLQAKKQREEDKKMLNMLKTKNEKIMHQIKKKDQEISRMKEQLRYSAGERLPQAKNSFEVLERLPEESPKKEALRYGEQDKYVYLIERTEKELAEVVRENSLMREKIYGIREELQKLNKWIDEQIFGERDQGRTSVRFFINHNLLFRKESLVQELAELVEITKDGLLQLKQMYKSNVGQGGNRTNRMTKSTQFAEVYNVEELNFKKKVSKGEGVKNERGIKKTLVQDKNDAKQQKTAKMNPVIPKVTFSQNRTPNSVKNIVSANIQAKDGTKLINKKPNQRVGRVPDTVQHCATLNNQQILLSTSLIPSNLRRLSSLQESESLSQIGSRDNSIVSHISIENIGRSKFDKWDILYQDDVE